MIRFFLGNPWEDDQGNAIHVSHRRLGSHWARMDRSCAARRQSGQSSEEPGFDRTHLLSEHYAEERAAGRSHNEALESAGTGCERPANCRAGTLWRGGAFPKFRRGCRCPAGRYGIAKEPSRSARESLMYTVEGLRRAHESEKDVQKGRWAPFDEPKNWTFTRPGDTTPSWSKVV